MALPAPYDVTAASRRRERAAELWAWTEHAIDRLEALAGDAFRRVGSLRLAVDDEERDELRAEFEALREAGFAADWIEDFEPPLEVDSPQRSGIRPTARSNRHGWYEGWRSRPQAGVEIREHDRLDSLEEAEGAAVVVCTDGYPSGLLGELEGLIVPTRGQVIATEPVPEQLFEVPHYGRHGFDYWHQAADGRIVAGGFRDASLDSEFTATEETTEPIQRALESFVEGLLGRPVRVDYRWAGIFGLVLDFQPVVGPRARSRADLGRRRLLGARQRARLCLR